jgi:hypothetical protein
MAKRRRMVAPSSQNAEDGEPVVSTTSGDDDFVLVPESCTEGWCLGAITEFEVPNGCEGGFVVVISPDGLQAGLLWEVGIEPLEEILPPDEVRWGLFSISFPHPTRTVEDLVSAFRAILPQLKAKYAELGMPSNTSLERTRDR